MHVDKNLLELCTVFKYFANEILAIKTSEEEA